MSFPSGTGAPTQDVQLTDPLMTTLVLRDAPPPGDLEFGRQFLFPDYPAPGIHFLVPVLGKEEMQFADGEGVWGDAAPIAFFTPSWSTTPKAMRRYALGAKADIDAQRIAQPSNLDVLARCGTISRYRTIKAAEYDQRASQLKTFSVGVNVGAIIDKTGSPWDQSGDMFTDIQNEVRRIQRRAGCPANMIKLALFNSARYAALGDPVLRARTIFSRAEQALDLPNVQSYLNIGEVRDCLTLRGIDKDGNPVDLWPTATAMLFYPGNPALMQINGLGDRFWGATYFVLGLDGVLPPIFLPSYSGVGVAFRTYQKSDILDPYCASVFTNVWSGSNS